MEALGAAGEREGTRSTGVVAGLTVEDIVLALVRSLRLVLSLLLVVGIGTVILLLTMKNRYVASVAFVPEVRAEGLPAQLATLAAIARVSVPASQQSQSPQFYASVLESRPIEYAVLTRRYAVGESAQIGAVGDSATLVEVLEAKGRTSSERLWNAARKLSKLSSTTYDLRTAIIRVSVQMHSPRLAADVANAYAIELDRFNREVRRSQARARRQFIENRLQEVSEDLSGAENAAKVFLARNRQYKESPTLQFEFNRLQRALTVQQELYLDLRRQLDAAKIAEVNDLPVISIIEPAIPPERKSGPSRAKWLVLVLVLAFLLTGAYVVIREYHTRLFPSLAPTMRRAWRQAWKRDAATPASRST